jgi:hypothetical protein
MNGAMRPVLVHVHRKNSVKTRGIVDAYESNSLGTVGALLKTTVVRDVCLLLSG